LTSTTVDERALIPRFSMIPTDLPFQFKRIQSPVKIGFAMTINKAQGQSFKCVGIDLRNNCITHGQLYVTLSKVGEKNA